MTRILRITVGFSLWLLSICAYAQSDKTTVGILPFSYVNTGEVSQHVETINQLVESAFVKANRQTVVSRSEFNALKEEIERNKGSEFIDGKAVSQGRQMGAQYLVNGRVLGLTKTAGNGSSIVKINLAVKVIDVETGQVIASDVLYGSAGDGTVSSLLSAFVPKGDKTTEAALDLANKKLNKGDLMTAAGENLSKSVYEWVSKRFVAKLSIVKVLEQDDRKGAQSILITGGSNIGLQNGSRLKIVEIEEIEVDGKTEVREIEVAQLKVDKVEGEKFSNCKVTNGGKELLTKFNAKAKLKAFTVR